MLNSRLDKKRRRAQTHAHFRQELSEVARRVGAFGHARTRQTRTAKLCRSVMHLASASLSTREAEGVRFELTRPFGPSGFQDRRNQPLCHPSGKLVIGDQQSVAKYSRNSKICSTGEYVHVNLSYAGAQENPTSNCRKGAKPVGDSGSRRILEPGEPIRKTAY
jgi:hypothetical protein